MHLGFIRALLEHVVSRRTGVLEVRMEDSKTRLYLTDGTVVYADQGTVGETLGRILLREKVINEASYERVLQAMALARQDGKPARFGEVVIELGILVPAQVDAALAAQVQHKLLNCLKWQDVTFSFTEKDTLGDIRAFPIEIEPVLLRAMRLIDQEQKLALLGQHDHSRPTLTSDATKLIAMLRLKTPEARFIRSIDGSRTTAELLSADLPDSVDPELLLCVLSLAGHLRFEAPTEEERKRLSGSPPAVARPRREEAPPSTKRGRRKSGLRSSVLKLAPSERHRIKQAALRLRARDVAPRSAMPSSSRISFPSAEAAVLVAEQHYRRGRRQLRENRLADAVVSFKRAVDLEPGAIEYRLYAAWASFKELPEKEPERMSAVRSVARRALKEDGEFGFAYYVLSHLAMLEGNKQEAEELLQRARRLDPSIEEEKPLRIAKGLPPKLPTPPPLPLTGARSGTTKAAALPPSAPTPPPMAPQPKPQPAKPPPPAIFAESSGKVKAAPTSAPALAAAQAVPTPPGSGPGEAAKGEAETDWYNHAAPQAIEPPPPSSAASKPLSSARPEPRSRLGLMVGMGIVLGGGAALLYFALGPPAPPASGPQPLVTAPSLVTTAPTSATTPSTAFATAATASTTVSSATTLGSAAVVPTTSAPASASAPPVRPPELDAGSAAVAQVGSGSTGILLAPAESKGRRVFVDGKSVGEGPGELIAPCGAREVKVGSAGKPKNVTIPCGGKVEL